MSNQKPYQEAFDELQQIVRDMQEGEIGIDDLSEKIKRATELIKFCQDKLSATEESVSKILQSADDKP